MQPCIRSARLSAFAPKALRFRAAIKSQVEIRAEIKPADNQKKVNIFLKSFRHIPLMTSTAVALHTPGKANQS
jgi:predicted metallopeptidase